MNSWHFRLRCPIRTTPRIGMIVYLLVVLCPTILGAALGQVAPRGNAPGINNKAGQTDRTGDIAELKEEIRQLKDQVTLLRSQNQAINGHLIFAPDVEVQKEDYAHARLRFQTRLVRKGPAPQAWAPLTPPTGVSEIVYLSGELRLKAWVNRPSSTTRRYPAILYLHGGFAFEMSDWEETKPYRDAGFVVLTPMLRAENGQPGAFSYFYDELDDVLAAAEYLTKLPYVDPKRLFVAGHSVGGTMTVLAALTSHIFRAAAAFSGAFYRPDFATAGELPFDRSDPREIQLRSPILYASSVKCPLRLYYGSRETWWGLMAQRFAALAKIRGLNVEAAEVEGDHNSHMRWSMIQSILFFQKMASHELEQRIRTVATLPKALQIDLGDGVAMKLARIEPGTLRMGSPLSEVGRSDDERLHEVRIANPYCLGVYEVTQAQYRQVMGMSPSKFSLGGDGWERAFGLNTDDFPVEDVRWEDAMDFCRMVSMRPEVRTKGWVVDLPTEAEWEYACRAGTETPFPFGNALSSLQADFDGNNPYGGAAKGPFLNRPTSVGSYAPNAWGLYDMQGNVLEWCKDRYDKDYRNTGTQEASQRVARGGFWASGAVDCRAARRLPFSPMERGGGILGFRVVVRSIER